VSDSILEVYLATDSDGKLNLLPFFLTMESLKELCVQVIITLNIRVDDPICMDVIRDSQALELLRADTAHHVAYLITRRIRNNIPLTVRTMHHGYNRERWIVMSNSSEFSNTVWYITFILPMARITRALKQDASLSERIKILDRFGVYFKPTASPNNVELALTVFQGLFCHEKKETYAAVYH
jgi:hypothetical protein